MVRTLLDVFFQSPGRVSRGEPHHQTYSQLPAEGLILQEVKHAIYTASAWKAPDLDAIPAVAWQQLWPVTKEIIFSIFETSLRLRQMPKQFKVVKIVPLRKFDKSDYAQPGAYRPISLLSTLGKTLELVVAERISYLAETHNLLSNNHFGARKRRSSVQALTVLQERIWDAWRDRKVLNLVSFDVKGAYNGVNREVLLQRLRERQIPEVLVRWIDEFCQDRRATVTVNGHNSPISELGPAGLPQGSPLSLLQRQLGAERDQCTPSIHRFRRRLHSMGHRHIRRREHAQDSAAIHPPGGGMGTQQRRIISTRKDGIHPLLKEQGEIVK
jgi:Reverse transcriptase (RNA-dependent DNA polymerase)